MEEATIKRYCEYCKDETVQVVIEDALEMEYHCTQCENTFETYKTFF